MVENSAMRIAYFDPFCGLSGGMILGALVDVGVPPDALKADLHKLLPVSGRAIEVAKAMQEGVVGVYLEVSGSQSVMDGTGQLPGRLGRYRGSMETRREIDADAMLQIIARSELAPVVKQASISAVQMINIALIQPGWEQTRNAEELWSVNTLIEIVGTMSALNLLGIDRVECGPIAIGGYEPGARDLDGLGVEMLLRTPGACAEHIIAKGSITLAGVAIMLSITSKFGPIPAMRIDSLGYGASRATTHSWDSSSDRRGGILRAIVGEAIRNSATALDMSIPLTTHTTSSSHEAWPSLITGMHQQSGRHILARSLD